MKIRRNLLAKTEEVDRIKICSGEICRRALVVESRS
ncbi:unnamed protein product [Arabidopsis lyrata]|nr:unnamed protein product [Arabidopsis lyrata]